MGNIKQAARAFNRAYASIAAARAEVEEADAGFDAGEFSGPWHADAANTEFDACLARVAARLGVDSDELYAAVAFEAVGMEDRA